MVPRPNAYPQRLVRAAGALVWRPVGDAAQKPIGKPLQPKDIEVLLVHRPRYRDWSWPKGKAELNEPLPQAAIREVEEETGLPVHLRAPLTVQRYRLGSGHIKEVHYWVGQQIEDDNDGTLLARPPVTPASRKEIDLTQWAAPAKAKQLLTRRGDKRLLNELVSLAASGQLSTSTVVLLRHAKAVGRQKWTERGEAERPLTRLGGVQALDLVPQLSAFGIDQISSSPWTRTHQTVLPYANLSRVPINFEDFLTEDGVAANPVASRHLVELLLERKTGASLVCLHRPGLKPLLQPLIEETAVRRFSAAGAPESSLSTAEMFVAHVAHDSGPHVVALERHATFTKIALR